MKLFDKVLDAYYDIVFRVEDLISTVKYKVVDLVDSVKGHSSELDNWSSKELDLVDEEPVKKIKKKKTSKKKKK